MPNIAIYEYALSPPCAVWATMLIRRSSSRCRRSRRVESCRKSRRLRCGAIGSGSSRLRRRRIWQRPGSSHLLADFRIARFFCALFNAACNRLKNNLASLRVIGARSISYRPPSIRFNVSSIVCPFQLALASCTTWRSIGRSKSSASIVIVRFMDICNPLFIRAASCWRTPPSRLRVSPHSRGSACDPHDNRMRAFTHDTPTGTAAAL